jgi:hypothetical protein
MGRDRVDLMKWTNEDYAKEYELIKKKISKLPAMQRKQIVELMNVKTEVTNEIV